MPILKRLLAALYLLLIAPLGQTQALPAHIQDILQRAEIPPYAVSAYVQEVGGGPLWAAQNADFPMAPASTMKLVTSHAALELLGPTFTWKTQAYIDGVVKKDVLHGNLIIKGSGDPKLVFENFWLFMRRVRAKGIREIRGNVILDRSLFEEVAYDPAGFDGDPLKPYNVGPDALLLNYKVLGFRFLPEESRRTVNVAIDPPVTGYAVRPPKRTQDECGDWRAKLKATVNEDHVRFDGAYSMQCGERIWYVHPYQMSNVQYVEMVFRRIWTELGGRLRGEIEDGIVPPTARLIAEWDSAAVSEIIRDINKFSNNVMARQVLLTIGAHALKIPATPERGAAVVKMWLDNRGIETTGLEIENGSGLSRIERISALTMGRLLVAAYQSPLMPEFISSMPLVGLDGTMRQRLRGQGVAGNAHIKTGVLSDVRSIAGYVLAASGKRYAVVFMINHLNAPHGQEAQDALLQWVYEKG